MTGPRKLISLMVIAVFALFYFMATAQKVRGYPPWLTTAQKLGYPAKDCTYCHTSLQGGSDRLNPRGTWLVSEKKRRNQPAVDVKWLADYKAGKAATKSKGTGKKKG